MNEHSMWYLSRASGMVAWVVLGITCLWGILLVTRMLKPADRGLKLLHRLFKGHGPDLGHAAVSLSTSTWARAERPKAARS